MFLYHGTHAVIGTINLGMCRNRTDFGKGFYLTDKVGTAQAWAIRKVELSGGSPTVIQYEVDDNLFELHGKRFNNIPELEWLIFICDNRRKYTHNAPIHEPRHEYNWVSGPIANDKIVDVVDEYLNNEISDVEAIRRSRALPATYQLSLHTQMSIRFLMKVAHCTGNSKRDTGHRNGAFANAILLS